jgi:hypothetical protein
MLEEGAHLKQKVGDYWVRSGSSFYHNPLVSAGKGMELEIIMLSEVSQA